MIFYKCDVCGDEFNGKDGMVNGYYENSRRVELLHNDYGWEEAEVKKFKVKRILELYKTIKVPQPHDVKAERDLCPRCTKSLEKP